jgi:Predicted transcriptional regulators
MFSVRQARLISELTQKEIAERLGVHRQTYMRWEYNPSEMPVGKAIQFSKMVNRSLDEIFFE